MPPYRLYAVISMIFAGLTAVLAKRGMEDIRGESALAVRTAVIFVLILGVGYSQGYLKDLRNLSPQAGFWLGLSGITTFLSWLYYYRAIKLGPVSEVALIDKASIVITLGLSFLILGEPVTLRKLAALAAILTGLLLLLKK